MGLGENNKEKGKIKTKKEENHPPKKTLLVGAKLIYLGEGE